MTYLISVIVVTHNRFKEIKEAINSLLNQTIKPFEILLIDNSNTPPLKLNSDFKNLKIIRTDTLIGLSNARNIGIKSSIGDYIAFIDDDCIPTQDWLEEIQKGIRKGYAILGGPLLPKFDIKPPDWWTTKDFGHQAGVGNAYGQHIWGGNMVFNKKVFDKIGFFDSKLGRQNGKLYAHEDTALISSAMKHFNSIFLPQAIVYHRIPAQRLNLRYILSWSYYAGKSLKIDHNYRIINTFYDLARYSAKMLNPLNTFQKTRRIKIIAEIACLLGIIL